MRVSSIYAALSVAAASHDDGLYRSQDAGQTWRRFDKVQVHGTIMSVALHPTDWTALPLPGPVKDIYAVAYPRTRAADRSHGQREP